MIRKKENALMLKPSNGYVSPLPAGYMWTFTTDAYLSLNCYNLKYVLEHCHDPPISKLH